MKFHAKITFSVLGVAFIILMLFATGTIGCDEQKQAWACGNHNPSHVVTSHIYIRTLSNIEGCVGWYRYKSLEK